MTWEIKKTDDEQPMITDEGKIVYIDPEKNELPLDPPAMYQKITDLGRENKIHREKYSTLKSKVSPLADIEDIDAWKKEADKALETVANFNDKDYLEASKVEELKRDMKNSYEEKLTSKDMKMSELQKNHATELSQKDSQIRNLMVTSRFAASNYFSGGSDSKTTLTSDIAEAYFGGHFKVEVVDGQTQLRAYYDKANTDLVYSKVNPGEPADFDEAITFIIDRYPGKDNILRANASGSGGSGGSGQNASGTDDLSVLQKQYKDALKAGESGLAVALKNKIFQLQQKQT